MHCTTLHYQAQEKLEMIWLKETSTLANLRNFVTIQQYNLHEDLTFRSKPKFSFLSRFKDQQICKDQQK